MPWLACLVTRFGAPTPFDALHAAAVIPKPLVHEVELLVEDHDWRELVGFSPRRHGTVEFHTMKPPSSLKTWGIPGTGCTYAPTC